MGDRRPAEIDGGQIEHHGLSNEEARRAGDRCVDLGEPLDDRHHRTKHKRDIGAAAQTDQLAGGLGVGFRAGFHGDRLNLSYRMVNNRLAMVNAGLMLDKKAQTAR